MKRWCLWLLVALGIAGLTLGTIFAIQPVPPFHFMEGYVWRRAENKEHYPELHERAYVVIGSWPDIKKTAQAELPSEGFLPKRNFMPEGEMCAFQKGEIEIILVPQLEKIAHVDGSEDCTVIMYANGGPRSPSVWDRILSLFGAQ
jgi:hypothetical protein